MYMYVYEDKFKISIVKLHVPWQMWNRYYQLGLAYCYNGQYDTSIENYKKAVEVIEAKIGKISRNGQINFFWC